MLLTRTRSGKQRHCGQRLVPVLFGPMHAPSNHNARADRAVVVVPCFNEAKRLPVQAFHDFLAQTSDVTFVFVDDGSTDDTPQILEQLRQRHPRNICTLRLGANVGKAEAVRRGMRAALRRQPTFVGYWDADLSTPLDAILRFVEVMQARPAVNLVMGSRIALLGRDIRRSTVRHLTGRVFATAASLVLRLPVYDTQCGAKLFRKSPSLRTLLSQRFRARWVFDVEILARMVSIADHSTTDVPHPQIYEYPLEQWHDVGGSRLQVIDFVVAGLDLAAIYWRYMRHSARSQRRVNLKLPDTDLARRAAA